MGKPRSERAGERYAEGRRVREEIERQRLNTRSGNKRTGDACGLAFETCYKTSGWNGPKSCSTPRSPSVTEPVLWGDATAAQHQYRVKMFTDNAMANIEGAARHQAAIDEIEKSEPKHLGAARRPRSSMSTS